MVFHFNLFLLTKNPPTWEEYIEAFDKSLEASIEVLKTDGNNRNATAAAEVGRVAPGRHYDIPPQRRQSSFAKSAA